MLKKISSLLVIVFLLMGCNTNIGQSADLIKSKQPLIKMGVDGKLQTDPTIFDNHVAALKKYAFAKGYSTQYVFLVDMAMHSGTKRFFVVEMKIGKILASGLVSHGCSTRQMKNGERKYSNDKNSLCTSLGKYKVGEKYYGKFGLAYKLTGLDVTNNNAYVRAIVLHSYQYVPDEESEDAICQSWGCPMVSPKFLQLLAGYIDASHNPILLDVFDSGK